MANNVLTKQNTPRATKSKLDPFVAHKVRRIHGAAMEIAKLANIPRSYVSEVINGKKPPSEKFTVALQQVMEKDACESTLAIFLARYPRVEQEAR